MILARPVAGWPDLRLLAGPLLAAGVMAAAIAPVAGRLELALPVGAAAYLVALGLVELAGGRRTGRLQGLLTGGLPVERGHGGRGLGEAETARSLAATPAQRVGQ